MDVRHSRVPSQRPAELAQRPATSTPWPHVAQQRPATSSTAQKLQQRSLMFSCHCRHSTTPAPCLTKVRRSRKTRNRLATTRRPLNSPFVSGDPVCKESCQSTYLAGHHTQPPPNWPSSTVICVLLASPTSGNPCQPHTKANFNLNET
jgi:hypothetical protein